MSAKVEETAKQEAERIQRLVKEGAKSGESLIEMTTPERRLIVDNDP